jgi:UDP-N-acetylmuramate dehydrogenase
MALSKEHNLPILDRWFGLPGTWGGGIVGNAGCFGLEMAKYFVSCRVYDVHDEAFETIYKDAMGFDYRTSVLKDLKHKIILSAEFDLSTDLDPDRYRDGVEFRQLKQPKGFTCGSFFKNPYPHHAGKLIDDAGLKGTRIGGAEISELHGNFFLNVDNASWHDILGLRDLAQSTVREKFGVELVPEVLIVGETRS